MSTGRADHRFEFQKRRQLFIRTHNETLSIAAMRQQSRSFARSAKYSRRPC
jgi:hypothetical protein